MQNSCPILSVLYIPDLSWLLMQYLDVVSIQTTANACKCLNSLVHSTAADVGLWRRLCRDRGFENTGATRTRGQRCWRSIYLSNVCINCYEDSMDGTARSQRGVVVIDIAGGSSLKRSYQQHMPVGSFGSRIALCVSCLQNVQRVQSFAERQKQSLQRLRRRKQGLYTLVWNELLNKIPVDKAHAVGKMGVSSGDRGRGQGQGQGAHGNDFLLRRVAAAGQGQRTRKKKSSASACTIMNEE